MRKRLVVSGVSVSPWLAPSPRPPRREPRRSRAGTCAGALARVTFGIDTTTVARYRALGREKFLDEQLHPPSSDPANLAAALAAIGVTQQTAETRLHAANRAEQQRINTLYERRR